MLPIHTAGSPLLLFGGTFDPVHQGHTELGFAARDLVCPAGWLVFVPAAISPHKSASPTPGKHRVEMLRLACRGQGNWWIWQEELNRATRSDEPSYWVDTLETARAHPGPISFLIGADQALAFNRWHKWQRILQLAKPVVIARDPIHNETQLREVLTNEDWNEQDAELFLDRATVLDTPMIDVNATAIRQQLATGDTARINGLDARVQRYAQERGLYHAAGSQ